MPQPGSEAGTDTYRIGGCAQCGGARRASNLGGWENSIYITRWVDHSTPQQPVLLRSATRWFPLVART